MLERFRRMGGEMLSLSLFLSLFYPVDSRTMAADVVIFEWINVVVTGKVTECLLADSYVDS